MFQCYISISSTNIRKPEIFRRFQQVQKWDIGVKSITMWQLHHIFKHPVRIRECTDYLKSHTHIYYFLYAFFYFRCCPVDCTVGSWGSWSACNAGCDKTGTQTRSRSITRQNSCNGKACPLLTHNRICNGKCCPKNCQLSRWSSWGSCISPTGKSRIDCVKSVQIRSYFWSGPCFPVFGLNTEIYSEIQS